MIRIGVNALYLIPGGVGGTEIYLRNLLRALAGVANISSGPDGERAAKRLIDILIAGIRARS